MGARVRMLSVTNRRRTAFWIVSGGSDGDTGGFHLAGDGVVEACRGESAARKRYHNRVELPGGGRLLELRVHLVVEQI